MLIDFVAKELVVSGIKNIMNANVMLYLRCVFFHTTDVDYVLDKAR